MKNRFIFLVVLFLSGTARGAPGEVNAVLRKIADGIGGMPTQSLVAGGKFGSACAALGDLDGDGNPDLAVGQEGDAAVQILFLSSNFSVARSVRIADGSGGLPTGVGGEFFGGALALVGDLDKDGNPELAVGAPGEDSVYLLTLGTDGKVIQYHRIYLPAAANTSFGCSCATLGDINGDGVADLLVGAETNDTGTRTDAGAAHILFLDASGAVKFSVKIENFSGGISGQPFFTDDQFGGAVGAIGDVDDNGYMDIAIGSPFYNSGGTDRGQIYLFSVASNGNVGGLKRIDELTNGLTQQLSDNDRFAGSLIGIGDIDGDGIVDLAAGLPGSNFGGTDFGGVMVFLLKPDRSIKSSTFIADNSGGLPLETITNSGAAFGSSLALLGRSSVNKLPLLVVGSPGDETGGFNTGAVYILELGNPPLTVTTLADEYDTPSGNLLSLREAIRDSAATNDHREIRFSPQLRGGTITLSKGGITISSQSVRISGEGLARGISLAGNSPTGVFRVTENSSLSLDLILVRNSNQSQEGSAFVVEQGTRLNLNRVSIRDFDGGTEGGGAVRAFGSVVSRDSTFFDNSAHSGGAIVVEGPGSNLTTVNCTFSRNSATGTVSGGGAIFCGSTGKVSAYFTSFVGNLSNDKGASILVDQGVASLRSCFFSGNIAQNSLYHFDGQAIDSVGNSSLHAHAVMPLDYYGGPTPVHLITPAWTGYINTHATVQFSPFPIYDQRGVGFARTFGMNREAGATEGTENGDFQIDTFAGLSPRKMIGNNRYSQAGVGQEVRMGLSGRSTSYLRYVAENEGKYAEPVSTRSDSSFRKVIRCKVFRVSGGRANVSAGMFRSGIRHTIPAGTKVTFQFELTRKFATKRYRGSFGVQTHSEYLSKADKVFVRYFSQ